jgi:hypothetical protein
LTADGMSCPLRVEHLFIRSLVVLPRAAHRIVVEEGRTGLLFVGDDWAEEHHDVELQDQAGRVLAGAGWRRGLPGSPGCMS